MHFVLHCPALSSERHFILIHMMASIPTYESLTSLDQLCCIMGDANKKRKISKYLFSMFIKRQSLLTVYTFYFISLIATPFKLQCWLCTTVHCCFIIILYIYIYIPMYAEMASKMGVVTKIFRALWAREPPISKSWIPPCILTYG